jgi:hypothetical protein
MQKIYENKMDNRVSKSDFVGDRRVQWVQKSVKEQRADGNSINLLRCALINFERNYIINSLSNKKRQYSTQIPTTLSDVGYNPWFITGFTDAEGSFIISIVKDPKTRTGWNIQIRFKIALHKKDLHVLEKIKTYFGEVGRIDKTGKNRDSISYVISSRKLITDVILPHFDKYSLVTQKRADYELFKRIIEKLNNKEHLIYEGLQEIVNIRATLNLGLSAELKEAFPHTIQITRPLIKNQIIPDPNWLAGYTSGEGCFYIVLSKSSSSSIEFNVRLRFILSQHSKDEQLMVNLINYFDCGNIEKTNDGMVYFKVTKFKDNHEKIQSFFNKYQIDGVKLNDFQDWCKVVELIKNKSHLSKEGLAQIINIKERMNKNRIEGDYYPEED